MKFIETDGAMDSNSLLETVLFFGLLMILVWVPLPLGSNRPWAWSFMEVLIFILSAVWCVSWLKGKCEFSSAFIKARPVLIIFVLWIVYLVFQVIPLPYSLVAVLSPERIDSYRLVSSDKDWLQISQDTQATLAFLLKTIAYVQIFVLVLLLVNTEKKVKLLAYVIIYSALFQALYGSTMTLSGIEYGFFTKKLFGIGNATGTFVNRNHLAGYLEMSLAIGIGLLISALRNNGSTNTAKQILRYSIQIILSGKFRLRVYLAFMVISLVLTHSRMGNVAFFSSLIIAGLLALMIGRHATRSTIMLLTSLIIIDMFIVGSWFGLDKVAERIERTNVETNIRTYVNKYAINYWRNYFITGSGGGTFFTIFTKYKGQDAKLYFKHAHNDYLELAAETGLIGISLLAMVVILTLKSAILALQKRRSKIMLGMAFACVMGVISIMIHSVVDFNLQIPANAVIFMVILAFGFISLNMGSGLGGDRSRL